MKIKKMYQGTAPENKILNVKSDSQTDTYSCDFMNGFCFPKTKLIGDGTGSYLIATFTPTSTYQRSSLIVATSLTGNDDTADTGIAFIGLASTTPKTSVISSCLKLGNIGIEITNDSTNGNIKVYVKKTVHYRHLHVYILGVGREDLVTLNM